MDGSHCIRDSDSQTMNRGRMNMRVLDPKECCVSCLEEGQVIEATHGSRANPEKELCKLCAVEEDHLWSQENNPPVDDRPPIS